MSPSKTTTVKAVFFDFGGVILDSPFDAFLAYEVRAGLPRESIRTINATNPHDNAWARFERNELSPDEFVRQFEAEALDLGYDVDAREVLACLNVQIRPAMVRALEICASRFVTALLTNNVVTMQASSLDARESRDDGLQSVLSLFDHIIESSAVGCRKPELKFYELACQRCAVSPNEVVFLDDLGVNLKPARAMGMRTIKVGDPNVALDELARVTGLGFMEGR